MLRRVALVRIDVSEELSAFIIRVTRISKLGSTLAAVTSPSERASVASYSCQRCSYLVDSCHPDDGGAKFLQNVGSYKKHGDIYQKTTFFIVTAVKTSNLT
jgi:hypothetical protein